ncbi:ISL3 family transposase [Paenibacillus xylaniclasticus]|uniref:ISL3 family transposase n=1 Tax=Paenibacillus xylaniclasticus TaxID=588083 RepID=UPI0013DFFDE4|nr:MULTISPECIES: ISL3 family transposase [Paenibacillus]GFN32392.1 ISL3 family transposase [Paenibacillus curdlanolyticus]
MDILNLPHLRVIDVKENEYDYGIHAETVLDSELRCPQCGFTEHHKHGIIKQMFWDIPMHGKRVGIWIKRQRYKCKSCSSTFMEPLPDMDDKRTATRRLVEHIERESLETTFVKLSTQVGVNEKTIRNIFNDYVAVLEAGRVIEAPRWLGMDEVHLLNDERFVLTDVENNTMIDLVCDRLLETVVKRLQALPKIERVELVTMDMWRPYKSACKIVIPKVPIVIDKFHVVKKANEGLEKVRLENRKTLSAKERKQLMHERFVLLKRRANLNDFEKEKLERWSKQFPILAKAYEVKEGLFEMYDYDYIDAFKWYAEWKERFPDELRPYFKDLLTSLKNWEKEIFNYFTHKHITNAYTEALNGLIKVAYRTGRGYSFEALRAKMIFTKGVDRIEIPKYDKGYTMPKRLIHAPLPNIDWNTFGKPEEPRNLGADISTIVRLIEEGLI